MDLFLLLSALFASLTGIARPAALPAAGVVQTQQRAAAVHRATPAAARRALALASAAVPAPRPDGYVAPRGYSPAIAAGQDVALPAAPERRRE